MKEKMMPKLLVPSGLNSLDNSVSYNTQDFRYLVRLEVTDFDLRRLGVKQKVHKAPATAEECYSMNFVDPPGEEVTEDFVGKKKSVLDIDLSKLRNPGKHVVIHIVVTDPLVELMSGGEFAGKHITVGMPDPNDCKVDPQLYLRYIAGLDPVRPVGGPMRSTVFACEIIRQPAECLIPFNLGLFVHDSRNIDYVLPVFVDPKVKNNG